MEHQLTPGVDLRKRVGLLVVLLIPVVLAPRLEMSWRIVASFMPLALSGTYRISSIKGEWFTTRMYFGFVLVIRHKCKLKAVEHVGAKYGGSEPGVWTFVLFGPIQYFAGYIFDFLVPAIGGPYELWIETAKGREFIAWQGCNQKHFEKNLELLTNQTGATVRAK